MDNYYVYQHVCPSTNKILYVGHGCKTRAWVMGTSVANVKKYGHRRADHQEYLETLSSMGYTPGDWVVIIEKGITKDKAKELEKILIDELKPAFNGVSGVPMVMTTSEIEEAKTSKASGQSYSEIAEKFGYSTMTIWRAVNDKNKAQQVR